LREELRGRIAHRRVGRDRQLLGAVAELGCRPAAVTRERERIDRFAVGRVDRDLVADGHGAVRAAGFLGAGERKLFDARFKDCQQPRLETCRVDGLEDLRVRELRLEDLLDQVLVRGAELRLVVDAGARFLVRVVGRFLRDHDADLGGGLHHQRLGQVALGQHRHLGAAAEHRAQGRESEP